MQYLVAINQTKALEWGLNAQQAMLFAFLHQVPTWATTRQIDGHTFYNISKAKIVEELPLLTDKPDTAYRLMKQLAAAGLIAMTSCDNRTYMRLTPKARAWNRSAGSEKSPTLGSEGEGSEKNPTSENPPRGVGKISEPGSEKSPTNHSTNDQDTNDQTPSHSGAGAASDRPDWFAQSLTDDGQPLGDPADQLPPLAGHRERQQPMTLDWQPDAETWQRACFDRGLPVDADVHLALVDFREHYAAQPGRTATPADWTRRFARWVHENLQRQQAQHHATGGHRDASRPAGSASPADQADQRRRVREQLANPEDLSWASGMWDDPAGGAEPGAPGGDGAAGGSGVHPADGAVPEDLGERVPERPGAEPGAPRAGAGAGPLAGAADPEGGRAGDERTQAGGEYLAADDPGADGDAGTHSGGLRYAAAR